MPLHGSIATMPLPDLLQWLATAGKTGELRIERNKIVKRILFERGRISGCGSDEPAERIGQFLLSRGHITADHLRSALAVQEGDGRHLGRILVSMEAIAEADLRRALEQKAEETIFSLFEWEDAEFRYEDGEGELAGVYPVDLRVEDVVLRGAQRWDESRRIRKIFRDPGIVLRRTDRRPPDEVFRNRLANGIYESIDGNRTVAEVLLRAHASEFTVTKFLFELFRAGIVEIARVPDAEPVVEPPRAPTLEDDLAESRARTERGDVEGALDLLDRRYRTDPGNEALRRLLAETEIAFLEKAYRHYLPAGKLVVLARPIDSLKDERLSPAEFFLLSRIDGTWDVKSIIQISPLREVEALRTLKRMREEGIIDLRDPA